MLEGYVRALSDMYDHECLTLTVGGKALKQPNIKLRESALAPYNLVICDYRQLEGGM